MKEGETESLEIKSCGANNPAFKFYSSSLKVLNYDRFIIGQLDPGPSISESISWELEHRPRAGPAGSSVRSDTLHTVTAAN